LPKPSSDMPGNSWSPRSDFRGAPGAISRSPRVSFACLWRPAVDPRSWTSTSASPRPAAMRYRDRERMLLEELSGRLERPYFLGLQPRPQPYASCRWRRSRSKGVCARGRSPPQSPIRAFSAPTKSGAARAHRPARAVRT